MRIYKLDRFHRFFFSFCEGCDSQHDRVRETLDTVKESSDVDEALAEMQAASVAREDW